MTRSYKHSFGSFLFVIAVIEVAASIPETATTASDPENLEAGMGDQSNPASNNSRWREEVNGLLSFLNTSYTALEQEAESWRALLKQRREELEQRRHFAENVLFSSFLHFGRREATSGVSRLLDEATHAQSRQGAAGYDALASPPYLLLLTAGDDVGRSKRWSLPRSRFVRIGRRSGEDRGVVPSDGQQTEPHFQKPDGSDASLQHDFIPLGRRASAFQLPSFPVDEEDDDGLQSRRSPGYRLTQSGVVRAGK